MLDAFDKSNVVVVDFAKVTYISSDGLRSLLIGHKAAECKSGKLIIINMPTAVMFILDQTRFSTILTIE